MGGEIGALREVLEQAVGVLAGPALPGASRIAEVDRYAALDAEAEVLGHLLALFLSAPRLCTYSDW